MRSLASLGAVYWFEHCPRKAARLNVQRPDITCDAVAIRDLVTKTGVTLKDLETYGRLVRTTGYLRQRTERSYEYVQGHTTQIFRSIKSQWDAIDGTLPYDDEDSTKRNLVGPKWDNNSCAVDATLFIAIVLDAGRIQVDQVSTNIFRQLPRPAQLLREIVSCTWGLKTDKGRSKMRNDLLKALHDLDPVTFPMGGAFLSVADAVDHCFDGLAQCSFTLVKTLACGDGTAQVKSTHVPSRYCSIYITESPVRSAVQRFLEDHPTTQKCGRGSKCSKQHFERKVVLDRMPPTLLVHLPDANDTQESRKWEPFHDIRLTWHSPREMKTITYEATGAIFTTGLPLAAHFVVVWQHNNGFYAYDGMKNGGQVKKIPDWFAVPARSARATIVVFRASKGLL